MNDKNLLDGLTPVTQTTESGKALARHLGMKDELPETIGLANGARLILSSKRDCYYHVSEKSCTCKAGQYGRVCRHRKALASAGATKLRAMSMAETLEQADANLSRMPYQYRRMVEAAREEAEATVDDVPEEQQYKAICQPVDEAERAKRLAAAKAKCEINRQRAREHQARKGSSEMIVDAIMPTTTEAEIQYWQKKQQAKTEA